MKSIFSTLLLFVLLSKVGYAQTHEFTTLLNTIIESDFSDVKTNLKAYGKFSKKGKTLSNPKNGITIYPISEKLQKIEILPTKNLIEKNSALSSPIELKSVLSIIPAKHYKRNYFQKIELLGGEENVLKVTQDTDSSIVSFFFKTNATFFESNDIVSRIRLSNSFTDVQSLELQLLRTDIQKFKVGLKSYNYNDFNIEPRYDYKNQYADSAEIFFLRRLEIVNKSTPAYWDILYGLYDANMRKKDYSSAANYMENLLMLTNGRYEKGYVKLIEAYTLSGNKEKSLNAFDKYIAIIKETESRFQSSFYRILNLALSNNIYDITSLKKSLIYIDDFSGFERHNPYLEVFLASNKSSLDNDFFELVSEIKKCKSFHHTLNIQDNQIIGLSAEEVMIAVTPPFWISLHDEKHAIELENTYFESEVSIIPTMTKKRTSISDFILENVDLPSNLKDSYAGLNFLIRKDGSISGIKINSKLPTEYIEKIKELLISTQPWSPGYKYDFPVDCQIDKSVFFKKK